MMPSPISSAELSQTKVSHLPFPTPTSGPTLSAVRIPSVWLLPGSPNGSLTSPARLKEAEKTLGRSLPLEFWVHQGRPGLVSISHGIQTHADPYWG